ncbi:hypothetical protein [Glycomyces albidus]|jgi:hypothetical protein|uniref:Uncharacterized protein n=1 Tax=Glycomyces albidus TaxID=2656774 RepID=A0A6L5G9D5_9ACTN|nr:hypothetical protein [Glycomyces albidus]MQM26312.1 hypothetical protein [Glycomyces albidus]
MRKVLAVTAAAAGAIAALGAASPAMAQNSGVWAGSPSLINADASSLAHWQICGQNILANSYGQVCDNRDHIGSGQNSGVWAGSPSLVNADASSALHWQICGQNVLATSFGQVCDNRDHISEDERDRHDKGADQGDY